MHRRLLHPNDRAPRRQCAPRSPHLLGQQAPRARRSCRYSACKASRARSSSTRSSLWATPRRDRRRTEAAPPHTRKLGDRCVQTRRTVPAAPRPTCATGEQRAPLTQLHGAQGARQVRSRWRASRPRWPTVAGRAASGRAGTSGLLPTSAGPSARAGARGGPAVSGSPRAQRGPRARQTQAPVRRGGTRAARRGGARPLGARGVTRSLVKPRASRFRRPPARGGWAASDAPSTTSVHSRMPGRRHNLVMSSSTRGPAGAGRAALGGSHVDVTACRRPAGAAVAWAAGGRGACVLSTTVAAVLLLHAP